MKKSLLKYVLLVALGISMVVSSAFVKNSSLSFISSSSLAGETEQDWGYGGENNPTTWGDISPEFELCELGRDQSPIDVSNLEEKPTEAKTIEFNYQSSQVEVIDNGSTIEVGFQPGNSVKIDGEVYNLLQFHFHTPSEHTIDGESSAMELHLVHQNEDGKLAVVGIMMDVGQKNPIIASVWDAIPNPDKANSKNTVDLSAAQLLPEDQTFISYPGSLTTPPCSEEVSWNLLLEPIEVSPEQIETFEALYPYNARSVQPINGRPIKLHSDN